MKNKEIREAAQKRGVRLWQIADELGIAESTFIRSLRYELGPERKAEVMRIIGELAKNGE